ncbi:cell wall-active antibiotics response protein LiaF [Paenibacillus oryzisoli]|uniref:cell wall-active antibiotics response protein LiaF n=1 Tax=Paenibacillus oryzisoli TaxID=1850517 RepID=UPI003D27A5FE
MNPHIFQRMMWGLVLVAAGSLFLLDQLGIFDIDLAYIFSTYWPVILIFYGLVGFVWQRKFHWGSSIGSLVVCGVGTVFLLKNLQVTDLSFAELFKYAGPIALILFGLSVIFRPSRKESPDWLEMRKAKIEARHMRIQERMARRAERHSHYGKHRNPWDKDAWSGGSGDQTDPAPEDLNQPICKGPLSEEEKAVLKDIHGDNHDLSGAWSSIDPPEPKAPPAPPTRQVPPVPPSHQVPPASYAPPKHHHHKYDDFVRSFHDGDVLHRHGFIGDVHLGQEAWELKPIQISHFIGDSVIDLTRASIPRGETPIHVSAFIGDVKIFIPNDMDVEVRVMASSFIGDMKVLDRRESGFLRNLRTQTSHYEEAEYKIIVTTSMFIGDITIKKIG